VLLRGAGVPQLVLPSEEVEAAKDGVLPGVREIDALAQGTPNVVFSLHASNALKYFVNT